MDTWVSRQVGELVRRSELEQSSGKPADTEVMYAAIGCWTIVHANAIDDAVGKMPRPSCRKASIILDEVSQLDTAGAWLLYRLKDQWEKAGIEVAFVRPSEDYVVLLAAIDDAYQAISTLSADEKKPLKPVERTLVWFQNGIDDAKRILSLLGAVTIVFARWLVNPFRIRLPSVVTHMMRTGLTAVPIIALMSFVIGAIIAQQGAYQLSFYGADALAVDFVGVLVTRNLGVLLTAIMIAGRSGSAYTAEIGSMRMREEIDALKVIGLDPVDVLLFPRIAALILVLPLLTVVANYAALTGAYLSLWIYIDLSWTTYVDRIRDAVPLSYYLMGIIKAPFMALIIGLIAMSEGLKVAGSSESLSRHTTIAVVKSIFMVIVVDGIFAVISANLGY